MNTEKQMGHQMRFRIIAVGLLSMLAVPFEASAADNTFSGSLDVLTSNKTVSITNQSTPPSATDGVLQVYNGGSQPLGLRVRSLWSGSTGLPYVNNDTSLFEVYNKTTSNSENYSWGVSVPNGYNDIPAGVSDGGERVSVMGWAVSVKLPGYVHAGTLSRQTGVKGVAGFQGDGDYASPPGAQINKAVGVQGNIFNASPGTSILYGRAGEFLSTASAGAVVNNVAVYAKAENGTASNYSFYGESGALFNGGPILARNTLNQSGSDIAARGVGNSLEFGPTDLSGGSSNIGSTASLGLPFLAFNAEADPTGNTFRTRGKPGSVILSDLQGAIIFARVPQTNASGQSHVESARFNTRGNLVLSKNPPASSSSQCMAGEYAWDENYTYVCVVANTWKRLALSSW